MTDILSKAEQVQDALTDCANNMRYLGKCVNELVSEAVKEAEQTGDVQQAMRWLEQGKRVKRSAWVSDCYLAPPGVTDSMIPGNTPEDVEWEKMLNAIADSANDLYAEACEQLSESRHHRIFDDAMVDRLMREALGMAR